MKKLLRIGLRLFVSFQGKGEVDMVQKALILIFLAVGIVTPAAAQEATYTGDQSAGINVVAPPTTVNVFNLSTDITPAEGVPGIKITSQGNNGDSGGSYPEFGEDGENGSKGMDLNVNFRGGDFRIISYGDNANGIFVQSRGGKGGNGGDGWAVIAVGIGGDAGKGGNGGGVTVLSEGEITTNGEGARGICTRSEAGDGGQGGDGEGLAVYGEGGDGGNGGTAKQVTVTNHGSITTYGDTSYGISAESMGGEGGKGGGGAGLIIWGKDGVGGAGSPGGIVDLTNTGIIRTYGAESSGILAQSLGGFAGGSSHAGGLISFGESGRSAGSGSDVTVVNSGAIRTEGDHSDAIQANSIGGGGGSGGYSGTSLSIFSLGGKGGAGGNGGNVKVTNSANLETKGSYSSGISAQSAGGGGGKGGDVETLSIEISYSVGGDSGPGGRGGQVIVESEDGSIITIGDRSHGIYAMSLGGGGGVAGDARTYQWGDKYSVGFAVGGNGGKGGDGGTVSVHSNSKITTEGNYACGIAAESIGGGGGSGGDSLLINLKTDEIFNGPPISIGASIGLGGNGGEGGEGGSVFAESTGHLTTSGTHSYGIFGHSIGGGGGVGGNSITVLYSFGGTNIPIEAGEINLSASIGGRGGKGGKGGDVEITNTGIIETKGDYGYGILAESIGGGGGAGGSSAAYVLSSILTPTKPFSTPALSFSLAVGGEGGAAGQGGAVTVTNSGQIWSQGNFAHGILAQSVGGGGGAGGDSFSMITDLASIPNLLFSFGSVVSLGGHGGSGGDGGEVNVDLRKGSFISTKGDLAHGILAQSVGGGGGTGGFSFNGEMEGAQAQFRLVGDGGGGGNGGTVHIESNSDIVTQGNVSHGIMAQSVGGGGGFAGIAGWIDRGDVIVNWFPGNGIINKGFRDNPRAAWFAGSLGGFGSGGMVKVTHVGNITTIGDDSHGIFAQSVGGGGGGSGGPVEVVVNGDVKALGKDSYGLLTQSKGNPINGNISLTIERGSIQGGSFGGSGIRILDGAENTVDNFGTISALSGNAIMATSGNEVINNYGTVTGSVDLGAGSNAFNNKVGATFNSGTTINLGTGNTLTNAGTLSPGGSGNPVTTGLNGNLVQTSSGTFKAKIYGNGEHDKLLVNGGSASLNGTLMVLKGQGPYKNGRTYNIIEADAVNNAFSNVMLPANNFVSFGMNQSPTLVQIEAHVRNFSWLATNRAESAMANYLDRILPTSTGELSSTLGQIQNLSQSEYSIALSSLSSNSYDNFTRNTFSTSHRFNKSLQYRMNNVRSYSHVSQPGNETPILLAYRGSDVGELYNLGRATQIQGKNGLWLDAFGQWGDQGEEDGFTGFDYFMRGATLGFDHNLSDKFMAGISIGYSRSDIDLDCDQGSGYIKSFYGSLYGSYFYKNLYIDGILSYGRNRYDSHRLITIGMDQRRVTSNHDGNLFSAYLQGGYYFDFKKWLIGPFASLQYIYLYEESFREQGAGGVSLNVDGRQTNSLVSELGVRLARDFKTKYGSLIPEVSAAWLHDFDIDGRVITSSFAGSPGASFSVRGQDVDRNGATLSAGITFIHKSGLSTSLRYMGEFREKYKSNGIMGEIRYTF